MCRWKRDTNTFEFKRKNECLSKSGLLYMHVLESIDALQQEIVVVLISFHSKGVFCPPPPPPRVLLFGPGFLWYCARLAVHYLVVNSVLGIN